jgi:hypothetical protein
LPAVHEREFRPSSGFLIRVPLLDATARTTLRIYALDTPATTVTVLLRDWNTPSEAPIAIRTLELTPAQPNDSSDPTPLFPAYAQSGLTQLFPEVTGRGWVSVEVQPTSNAKIWAFATITDNATNAVTTVLP